MPPDELAAGGAGAVTILLMVLTALRAGWLRTGQEVASIEKHAAQEVAAVERTVEIQRARAERAEKQVDVAMSNNGQLMHGVIQRLGTPIA